MSTLHERLVAKVAEFTDDPPGCAGDRPWFCGADDYELAVAAVRAVVELHAPEPHKYIPAVMWCGRCNLPANQCVEARAIAEALGIGETPK